MTKPPSEQTVLVTGASSGIGLETARSLARAGARVVLVSRGSGAGARVTDELKRETGNDELYYYPADLSSLAEVRRVAAALKSDFSELDVLVNNAGALFSSRQTTADGVEMTLALNHLNYYLLTQLLLEPLLKSSAPRVVNVASAAEGFGKIYFGDLMLEKNYRAFRAYGQSKLANLLFTYQLARFLKNTPATVNALHPGFVASNFGSGQVSDFLFRLARPLSKTPEQGAATAIYLATSPEVAGVSGRYFIDQKPAISSRLSYDVQVQARLWRVSRKLVRLTETEGEALRQVTPRGELGHL